MARPVPSLLSDRVADHQDLPDDLVAVCDALALKALEKLGKLIGKTNRSQHALAKQAPWHLAHVAIVATDREVDKGLWGAWDVAPYLVSYYARAPLTVPRVISILDRHVRTLVQLQLPHDRDTLRLALESAWLGEHA